MRKVRIFMKITKIALLRSFRAPCENVALAQGILMVLGDIFTFWSKKCDFLTFCSESALFSLFTSKVHFSHFLAKKRFSAQKVILGAKVRFGSSGSPRRGPGTAPDGSPEGASPGTPPNPARARKRLKTKLNSKRLRVLSYV